MDGGSAAVEGVSCFDFVMTKFTLHFHQGFMKCAHPKHTLTEDALHIEVF